MDEENDVTEPILTPIPSEDTATSGSGGATKGGVFARIRSIFTRSSPKDSIEPYQQLIISPKVYKRSVNALRFAIFVDAVAGTIEQPNYRESLFCTWRGLAGKRELPRFYISEVGCVSSTPRDSFDLLVSP